MHPATTAEDGVDAVRERLRALATGERPEPATDDERLVADAESALERVETAARFAEEGGFDRLRTVVETAGVDGRIRRRARTVLDTLAAYRTAYERAGGDAGVTDAADRAAADHFRSTHDSHIPGAELPDHDE